MPITGRRLLNDVCGIRFQGNQISVGAAEFPARMTICSKELPALFEAENKVHLDASDRELRFALERRPIDAMTSVVSPSQAIATSRPSPDRDAQIAPAGVKLTGPDLVQATDRGIAICTRSAAHSPVPS